jgi:tRNA (adenine37-N6)-methyltransferase
MGRCSGRRSRLQVHERGGRVSRESQDPTQQRREAARLQRHPQRPNHLGLSVCELLHVDGLKLTVRELDAFDGSPVLDVKPYRQAFGPRGEVREPRWSRELMMDYY